MKEEITREIEKKQKKLRIAKFLATCGIASRRKCEELVLNKKIKVNGITICDLSYKVSSQDKVEYSGKILKLKEKIVIALNKPPGYISTARDDFKRKTVLDLVKEKGARLFPVGRLDADSRGLIILTNDGELAYRILHPKFKITKVYEVLIEEKIKDVDIIKISKGIEIEGRELFPLSICTIKSDSHSTLLEIKIIEGRKRIIRKTFASLGYRVLDLKRTQIGCYRLKDLEESSYRILNKAEISSILS